MALLHAVGLCVVCVRAPSPGLQWPAVPEQGSGERLMSSEPTSPCTVTLNGHSVNPLKVHPPAAVARHDETESRSRREKDKKKEQGEGE